MTGGFLRHPTATSTTVRIIHTSLFSFFYYLTIGLLLAILPGFVHLHLGLSPLWAGVAVSSQYLATLVTRPKAGRMTDVMGPRATVLLGQLTGLMSGLCLIVAALLQSKAVACFAVLLISRLILGCGESCVATGAITWGLGRVGPEYAAQVISWSGIANYGAMAAGAPLGIWLENRYGLESIAAAAVGISVLNLALALPLAGVPILRGAHLAFSRVLGRVGLHGLGLTLGTVGFAAIASFTGLYYSSRHWTDPALALILFGSGFIVTRLLFSDAINRWGGFLIATVSFIVEAVGLFVLWSATTHDVALAEQLSADVASLWSSQLSELKLSKLLLIRITGLHSVCIRDFSIWRWALQARSPDLSSGSSVTRLFSSLVQESRAAGLCLLSSSIAWFVSRTHACRGRHSSRWKQEK
jgi:MFS family permease